MHELIPLHSHDTLIQAVNARELHAFLQVQTAFKDWIARRISEYGFLEDVDFRSKLSESTGGRPTKEYDLYYLNKSQHSDKQVEHFRYFEKSIDKFKSILENE